MNQVEVRKMDAQALSQALYLSRRSKPIERIRYLSTALRGQTHLYTYFAAFVGERVVGCAMLAPADNGQPHWVCTRFIGVDPEFQGRRIGRALNEAIFAFCASAGMSLVSSSYTHMGAERLKRLNAELAARYQVTFEDPDDVREAQLARALGRALTPDEIAGVRIRY